MTKIISLQDISCYGQCSLTVALPIISHYGIEVSILPSSILSTHTGGFKNFTELDLTDELFKIVNHWKKENLLFDALYTGYIGDVRQLDLILDIKNNLVNGKLIVDPAMADNGKLYCALSNNIVDGMKKIIKYADIALPNITEACLLLDKQYKDSFSLEEYKIILKELYNYGVKLPILTGVIVKENRIGAMAYDGEKYYSYNTKKIPVNFHGTGDIFSSVFIGKYLETLNIYDSLKEACDFVYLSIKATENDSNHKYGTHFEKILLSKWK